MKIGKKWLLGLLIPPLIAYVFNLLPGGGAQVNQHVEQSQWTSVQINTSSSSVATLSNYSQPQSFSACEPVLFADDRDAWNTKRYKGPDDDGYYTAKEGPIPYPVILRKDPINIVPGTWEVKYEVDTDLSTSEVAPFFFVIGDPALFRLFVNETIDGQVGFEWFVPASASETWPSDHPVERKRFSLPTPIKEGTKVIVTIKSTSSEGNVVDLEINIEYIDPSGNAQPWTRTATVKVPDDPRALEYLTHVGFGVPVGYHIKPIQVSMCSR